MVLSCSSVSLCMHPHALLTRYLEKYSTDIHQTYINDALCDSDERFTFWGQKVTVHRHRHSGITSGARLTLFSLRESLFLRLGNSRESARR